MGDNDGCRIGIFTGLGPCPLISFAHHRPEFLPGRGSAVSLLVVLQDKIAFSSCWLRQS